MNVCELMTKNTEVMNSAFFWEKGLMTLAGASIYTGVHRVAEVSVLKESEKILQQSMGFFSNFRGNVKVPLICKMSLQGDPLGYLRKVETVYELLKTGIWSGDEYKVMAAMSIADHVSESDYALYAERTNIIYRRMKDEHSFLTSREDIPFAAMLSVSGIDIDQMIIEMENCYRILKGKFFDSDAVQSLSHVLAMDLQGADVKCSKAAEIFDVLKKAGHRFGSNLEIATLGTLTNLNLSAEEIAAEIIEADVFLKDKKGFGNFVLGAKGRRMYAAEMVAMSHDEAEHKEDVMLTSMLAMTIAAEVAMMICVSASISASNAASASH